MSQTSLRQISHFCKLCVVGDPGIGKTSLLKTYKEGTFPDGSNIEGIIANDATVDIAYDGKLVRCTLCDTLGSHLEDRLRVLRYVQTDVFWICFSIAQPDSLEQTQKKWREEIDFHYNKDYKKPIILVGTKADLRDDLSTQKKLEEKHQVPVTKEQGKQAASSIGAEKYFECSALDQNGLKELFESVVIYGSNLRKNKDYHEPGERQENKCCTLL